MTTKDKQLLLKDLCARLPYRVKCADFKYDNNGNKIDTVEVLGIVNPDHQNYSYVGSVATHEISRIKPYLRPMSSMTDEEHGRYMEFIEWSDNDYDGTTTTCINKELLYEYLDFIYSHHLDDNNLIGKGLALKAPEDMYKSE